MRIIYLHQYFVDPATSAGGSRSYEMARRLVAAGHQVTLLTSSALLPASWAPGAGWHAHEKDGIRIEVLRVPYGNEMPFGKRIEAFVAFALGASWRVRKHRADVVFATSTPLTILLPGLVARLWHRIPMVFEVRDLWPELPIAVGALRNPILKWAARVMERIAYHASVHVVALSPGIADGVVRRGIPATRVSVIPNSCDVSLFDVPADAGLAIRERLRLDPEQPLVVYAGTFGRINGVGYLVAVASAMRAIAPEVRFLLVGSGAERDQVIREAQRAGVWEDSLWVWPPVVKQEMPAVLAAATVAMSVFLPLEPMWNNSANKFFDALAAGKPVAINYGGWQADLLRESGAGVVLPAEDPMQAARALAMFLRNRGQLGNAAAAARELASTRFARDRLAKILERVLLQAVHAQ
jgi:glycosyltransferase involved in cell wall biosynthesis